MLSQGTSCNILNLASRSCMNDSSNIINKVHYDNLQVLISESWKVKTFKVCVNVMYKYQLIIMKSISNRFVLCLRIWLLNDTL